MISGTWPMCSQLQCSLLPAPLLGLLAKRYQLFRPVFFGGFISMSVSLGTVRQASALGMWVALAMVCGLGVGAVATMAPLFAVDFAPKAEMKPANRMAP